MNWIGTIPSHWRFSRLKHLAAFTNGMAFKPEDWRDDGVPIIRIDNLNGSTTFNYTIRPVEPRYHIRSGDLLFAWSGNPGTSFGPFVWQKPGLHYLNQHIFRVDGCRADRHWLYWALKAATRYIEEEEAHGIIGMVHITKSRLGNVPIAVPPLSEQRAIAAFLDRETARMDQFIHAGEHTVDLLRERRAAMLHHLVFHLGNDPAVPQIPLRYVVRPKEITGHPELQVLSLYRDHGVVPKDSRTDNFNKTPLDLSRYQVVGPGDLVVNKMKAWQGSVAISRHAGIVSPDYLVCKIRLPLDLSYLHYLLRSPNLAGEYARRSTGIRPAQWRLYWEDMATIRIPVPDRKEQERLAARVLHVDATVDRALRIQERLGEVWAERRKALITAAVTGEIDVSQESVEDKAPTRALVP